MRKNTKNIYERLIGKTDESEINLIKTPSSYIESDELENLERINNQKVKPKIIFDTNKMNESEKQLFKIILINNGINESFVGRFEIYEIWKEI